LLGVHELDGHSARLLRAPAPEQLEDDVLAGDPGPERAAEAHAPLFLQGEVDVAGRPPEAERGRSPSEPDRAVGAVRAAVRVGARDELPRKDEALLREVEVKDPVAGRRVVRLLDPVALGELATDRGLVLVGLLAGEDEGIVREGRLTRKDGVAARNLVERVDRE